MNAILFEHFHGAVTRVPVTETAVPHRAEGFNLLIPSVWLDPADTEKNKTWTRATHAAFSEHLAERRWLNYLVDDQGASAVRGSLRAELGAARQGEGPRGSRERVSPEPQHPARLIRAEGSHGAEAATMPRR